MQTFQTMVIAATVLLSLLGTKPQAVAATKYKFTNQQWKSERMFQRQEVSFSTEEKRGTIIISTRQRFLWYVLGNGRALRYGIGVGRAVFQWSGTEKISRKVAWPIRYPPKEMREREPALPMSMPGGIDNPLGARALYLGDTLFRIHGTAQPWTIGPNYSSGCILLTNDNAIDLFERTSVGTKVIVQ